MVFDLKNGFAFAGLFALLACSGTDSSNGSESTGGSNSIGGTNASGGASLGGAQSSLGGAGTSGGVPVTGGANSAGGNSSVGGTAVSTGGQLNSGGAAVGGGSSTGGGKSTGGTNSGGNKASGGTPTAGGTSAAGGGGNNGGTATTGGSKATGGVSPSTGGMSAGGASSTGGSKATGGASPATGGSKTTGGASSTGGTSAGGATSGCGTGGSGYFVDSTSGNDSSDGRSSATAWKSLPKVNATTFQPGDHLCFRAGGSWSGQLAPKGSGSSAAPIVIDEYGTGAKPRFAAGTSDLDTLRFVNQAYWEINNLEVTNTKSSVGDYRGISVLGRDAGTLNHFYIRTCNIHDVTGEVNWIGGSTADNSPGVTFQTGWDASKRTGGIVFEVESTATTPVKTKFNDVVIENNVITDCSFAGISFKQLDGNVHWGIRNSATDSNFTPHTNIAIRNNYFNQHNTSYGCNALYMTGMQTALIEGNVVAEAGTSGIELYYTDSVTVQHNETYGTVKKSGGADYNGIDTDKATTKTIIQYNYIHDNGDGILLCQFSFGNSIVRYNVITNNSRYQIYLHSDAAATSAVYNNAVYINKYNASLAYGYGTSLDASYTLTNNIFDSTGTNAVLTTGGGIVYNNNLYFGSNVTAPASDTRAITADPRFASPGQGGTGTQAGGPAFASLTGYKLSTGSPAINAGTTMANNGGLDFWGTALYTGAADIGAYEAP